MSLPAWAVTGCDTIGTNPESNTYTISGTCTYGKNEELTIGEGKSVTLQGGEGSTVTATLRSDHSAVIYVESGLLTLKGSPSGGE